MLNRWIDMLMELISGMDQIYVEFDKKRSKGLGLRNNRNM